MKPLLAILGGTFDPVHRGHVQIAKQLLTLLPITEIRFLPCKQPLLKNAAQASAHQRLAMLQLALQAQPDMVIDQRELLRDTPSYMVDTLRSLQHDFPDQALTLILGMDAFVQLPQWHQWQQLLKLAHLIVINRKEAQLPSTGPLAALLKQRQITQPQQLTQKSAGNILVVDLPLIDISSTAIRQAIADGKDVSTWLSDAVYHYIKTHNLYQS